MKSNDFWERKKKRIGTEAAEKLDAWAADKVKILDVLKTIGITKPGEELGKVCLGILSNDVIKAQAIAKRNGDHRFLKLVEFLSKVRSADDLKKIVIVSKKNGSLIFDNNTQIEAVTEGLFASFEMYSEQDFKEEIGNLQDALSPRKTREHFLKELKKYQRRRCKELYKLLKNKQTVARDSEIYLAISKILFIRGNLLLDGRQRAYNPFQEDSEGFIKDIVRKYVYPK